MVLYSFFGASEQISYFSLDVKNFFAFTTNVFLRIFYFLFFIFYFLCLVHV